MEPPITIHDAIDHHERAGDRACRRQHLIFDKVLAADPGLTNLTAAITGIIVAACIVFAELAASRISHSNSHQTLTAVLLAVITAYMVYSALRGSSRHDVLVSVLLGLIVEIAALGAGIATNRFRVPLFISFAAVTFAAMAIRRIGPVWRRVAVSGWVAFLLTVGLRLPAMSFVPFATALVVACLCLLVVMLAVPHLSAKTACRLAVSGLSARWRDIAAQCARVLTARASPGSVRRLMQRLARLTLASLQVTSSLPEPASAVAPEPGSAAVQALRAEVAAGQVAFERLASIAIRLARSPADASGLGHAAALSRSLASTGHAGRRFTSLPGEALTWP